MERLWQDLWFALRVLRKSPGFTAVAAITLALGIGANTAIFSVVNALLIRPLPFTSSRDLVWISNSNGTGGPSAVTSRALTFRDLRERNRSFADMAAYHAFFHHISYNLTGNGNPERLLGVPVTANFFALLGVQPAIGRASFRRSASETGGER